MFGVLLLSIVGASIASMAFDTDEESDATEVDTETDNTDVDSTDLPDILPAADNLAGNDVLDATVDDEILNGGSGDDTLSSFDFANVQIHGGEGDDDITFQSEGHGGTDAGIVLGGSGSDSIDAFGTGGGTIDGGEDDDIIRVQGSFDSVAGGDGDDTIFGDSMDSGGGTPLAGNAGDDLLISSNSPAFSIGSQLDGGDGDDTLQSGVLLDGRGSVNESIDTLTGGDGSDEFIIDINYGDAVDATALTQSQDEGVIAVITDFVPGEDVLALPEPAENNETTIEFFEADDASYTDVIMTTAASGNVNTVTYTVRLEGTSDLTSDDVILTTERYSTHTATLVSIDQNQYS